MVPVFFIIRSGPVVQETKLVSGVSKVSYILGYSYKNLWGKDSYGWFLKGRALLYFACVEQHLSSFVTFYT